MFKRWISKFSHAFRGVAAGVQGQSSFLVHLPCAVAAIALAVFLNLDQPRFCVIVLCVVLVLACELFNSSLECLAKAISNDHNKNVGRALDIAAGAVLVAAAGSVVIGGIVFGQALYERYF